VRSVIWLNGYSPSRPIPLSWIRETHHPLGPLIDHLHQSLLELLPKIVVLDRTSILLSLDVIRDPVDHVESSDQLGRDDGLGVGFLDEDKDRQESDDLFRCVIRKDVLEDQFGEDELVSGVNLIIAKRLRS